MLRDRKMSKAKPMRHMKHTFGFYVVFLKDEVGCNLVYGHQRYDYQKGSIVCLAPGQVIGIEDTRETFLPQGWALCFDPELIHGTSLGHNIKEYSYFSYNVNEALLLSEKERTLFVDSLQKIQAETGHSIGRLSKRLISMNIDLLLGYCLRFYERQFITREPMNRSVLARFETLLDKYFSSNKPSLYGLPTVTYCAGELCLSPNYFGDMIKSETGMTAKEHIRLKTISMAKEQLVGTCKSISQVSYDLGFQYPHHFTRMFKQAVGKSPNEYRAEKS